MFPGKKSDSGMQSVVRANTLRPLHCVWAKCRGFPWYPGMVRCIVLFGADVECNFSVSG